MGNAVVYRPAYDAEIEYLESDGNSYIDTGLKASSDLGILAHIQNSKDNRSFPFGGADGMQNKEYGFQMSNGTYSSFRFGNGGTGNILPKLDSTTIYEFNNIDSHNIINVNDIVYQTTFNSFTSDCNFHLFRENRGDVSQGSNNGVRIYNFKIYQNSTLVRDFIPVRIGTTGYMYDKVTKQLFSNAGTGNFILGNDVVNATIPKLRNVIYLGGHRCIAYEKVYEEYNWLEVEMPPNCYTCNLPINSENFSYSRKYTQIGNTAHLTASNNYAYFSGDLTGVGIWDGTQTINYRSMSINNLEIVCTSDKLLINSIEFPKYGIPVTLSLYNASGSVTTLCKQSKVIIDNAVRYVPCKLTIDLPAYMDANNIPRTKGTSGMWDKVSGRFFGNVASSGTFKAVNLAEGVDYEVHDILKTLAENTSSAPYDVAYFRFQNYISLSGKVLTLKLGNVYRDYNLAGNIVDNARYYILIYRAGSITTMQERLGNTVLNSVSNSSSTVEIDFDNNVMSVGTSTMNIQGTGYYTFGENNVSWGTEKYLKGLTISDVLNLIPVKLLHSIPSKYDANGISRNAGECGMYDTVNDKFYGNVASSGTFTVSND